MNRLWLVSHLLLWLTVAVQGVILLAVMRQVGSLLLRVGSSRAFDAGVGPEIGDSAPWTPRDIASGGKHTLLTFLSTSCGSCDALVPALNAVSSSYSSRVTSVVLAREEEDTLQRWVERQKLKPLALSSPEAFDAYEVDGTPYAFVVDPEGQVAGRGGVNHIEHLEALIRGCLPTSDDGRPARVAATAVEVEGGDHVRSVSG